MKSGQRVPRTIVDLILRKNESASNLTYAQIAEMVLAETGIGVDKSTVGNILRRRQRRPPSVSHLIEDPNQAEVSGHWPKLRDTAEKLGQILSSPLPQLLGFPWTSERNPALVVRGKMEELHVSLTVENVPLFTALGEHIPDGGPWGSPWALLGRWKARVGDLVAALDQACQRVREKTEIDRLAPMVAVNDDFYKTVVLPVATEASGLRVMSQHFEPTTGTDGQGWLMRWYWAESSHRDIGSDPTREDLDKLERVHRDLQEHMQDTPAMNRVTQASHDLEAEKRELERSLELIANLATFPGKCHLWAS